MKLGKLLQILGVVIFFWCGRAIQDASGDQTMVITNNNGDFVTLQLSGAGTMSVSLLNGNRGPINQLELFNTDRGSALSVKVKKSPTGGGRIAVNSIVVIGSLGVLKGKTMDIVGNGIDLEGSLGNAAIGNMVNSSIIVGGNGVASNSLALVSLTAGSSVIPESKPLAVSAK
jgi:hypothetical protein